MLVRGYLIRPRKVNLWLIIQSILYVLVTGYALRLLSKDYSEAPTVY